MSTADLERPQPPADYSIRFHGVFRSPALEGAFRRSHLADDIALAGACLVVVVVGGAVFNLIDYRLFSLNRQFYLLLEVRLLSFLVALVAWRGLRHCTNPTDFDRLVLLLCFFAATMSLYVSVTRPPGQIGHAIIAVMMLALAYAMVPLPLLPQIVWAGMASIAYIAFLPERGPITGEISTTTTIAAAFVTANILGIVTSWRLNHRRRLAFAAMLREAEVRCRLEQALAEVRTLRGYLSICAWCKCVRDEQLGWQNVEAFVQDRTHAQFTHGICPACFQKHFGALSPAPENHSSGLN